ncbi:MAG: DUF63 family protein [Candidatus Aenigmatarchaeota archaeon]
MADILQEYFINPILINGWFNPVNTLLWGIILVVASFLVYNKILKPLKIPVDRQFAFATLPFVFWASSTRVLRDFFYGVAREASVSQQFMTDIVYQASQIQQTAYSQILGFIPLPPFAWLFSCIIALFPTPGSYVFTFIFALFALLLGLIIQRLSKIQYWKAMLTTGAFACLVNIFMIPLKNPLGLGMILGITISFSGIFFLLTLIQERKVLRIPQLSIFSRANSAILSCHILDASATFVSVTYFGYLEQHPVPRFFIESFGGWTFFALKLAVLLPSLWIIDKYAKEGEFRNFLKIVILILGLAPGLRDAIRLGAGV